MGDRARPGPERAGIDGLATLEIELSGNATHVIVLRIVDEHFAAGGPLEDGFILDGFPRTLVQAEELEKVLTDHPLDVVLNIEVPTETILHRIAGRRVCINCGAKYHVTARPKVDWTCDVCGGEVIQRDDDTEAAVANRLEVYARQTVPIIDFYCELGKLVEVDGVGEGTEVQERLIKEIDGRIRLPVEVDHPQERRAARADAPGGRSRGRDARGVHPRPRCRGRHPRRRRGRARRLARAGGSFQLPRLPRVPRGGCTSPNDVIVHGIPSAEVVLQEGDILSIDCGAIIEGWHGDAAVTVPIGEVDEESHPPDRGDPPLARRRHRAGRRRPPPRRRRRRGRGHRRAGRVLGGARVRGSRHRHRHARGPQRARTTGRRGGG